MLRVANTSALLQQQRTRSLGRPPLANIFSPSRFPSRCPTRLQLNQTPEHPQARPEWDKNASKLSGLASNTTASGSSSKIEMTPHRVASNSSRDFAIRRLRPYASPALEPARFDLRVGRIWQLACCQSGLPIRPCCDHLKTRESHNDDGHLPQMLKEPHGCASAPSTRTMSCQNSVVLSRHFSDWHTSWRVHVLVPRHSRKCGTSRKNNSKTSSKDPTMLHKSATDLT